MSNRSGSNAIEVIYATAGALGALATIRQAIKVWSTHTHHIDGMSLITWTAYLMIGVIGVIYGVVKKQRAMVVSSGSYVFMYLVVVLGIVLETRSFW